MASTATWLGNTFAQFSTWMDGQPEWVQGLVVGLILIALPAFMTAVWKLTPKVASAFARRRLESPAPLPSVPDEPTRPRLGAAEALAAEDEAVARMLAAVPAVTALMNRVNEHGKAASERARALTKGLQSGDRNTRAKFNYALEGFAAEVNRAMSEAEAEVDAMQRAATTLHDCYDAYQRYGRKSGAKPPNTWVESLPTLKMLRESVRGAIAVYGQPLKDDLIRGLRNDLDDALDRQRRFRSDVTAAMESFERVITRLIEAAERGHY